MAIEFRCSHCKRLLRTGDETAGRQAQCPECGAIMAVPTAGEPRAGPLPPAASEGNPFAWPAADAPPPSDNPYQSPMSPAYLGPGQADPFAKQRVAGPATALIVTAVLGLIGNTMALGMIAFVLSQRGRFGGHVIFDDFGRIEPRRRHHWPARRSGDADRRNQDEGT